MAESTPKRPYRLWAAPSMRWMVLSVNAIVLLVPVLAVLGLKLYQTQFIRQTEIKLISEAALIGEMWRTYLAEELGQSLEQSVNIRPPDLLEEQFTPIKPVLDGNRQMLPPLVEPTGKADNREGPSWRAGARLMPILERAQIYNLTGAKVLNTDGCVVATTRAWMGSCFADTPEIAEALAGRYAAVARERILDENPPPLSSISRRGDVRVFSATPIFADGEVIGAVWMSRTSLDPLKAAWLDRRPLLAAFLASAALTALVSLLLSWRITKPLQKITEDAQAIARGERSTDLAPKGVVPAEIRTLAGSLSTMTRQLSDRADYIADYAANVTHELKSPITSIKGAVELLLEEGAAMPEEQRAVFLGNVHAGASRMERIVSRLLELARIQSAPETSETVEVKPFLVRMASLYGDQVRLDIFDAPPTVEINRDHLESAVRNLLDNAVRHGESKPVDLWAGESEGRLCIRVTDQGHGISEANRSKVFERFFTTNRDEGGAGLGLAIVKAVVETRGGTVTLQTSEQGTSFTIRV